MKHYAVNRCEPSIEALNFGGGGDQGRCERRSEFLFLGVGLGGQDGCERRIEVFVKLKKKNWGGGVGSGGGGVGLGGHCRCEQRSEVFVKIIFFLGGGSGGGGEGGFGGVRVNVNEELKFL